MSIPLTDIKERAAAGQAKYVFVPRKTQAPAAPPATVPDKSLADALSKVAAALASAQETQREAILQTMQVKEQVLSALGSMHQAEPAGPWKVTVTKRDPLGRIAEVEFKPN